jgi:hypothetical protein
VPGLAAATDRTEGVLARRAKKGWPAAFLEALGRTGNVALSARIAGVDKGTAYHRRHRNRRFARAWDREKAKAEARVGAEGPLPGSPGRAGAGGDDLVIRYSKKEGAQMVQAGPGRFSPATRKRFLRALRETGNVRRAAAEAGISTTALYNRRRRDPLLEADWAAEKEAGCRRVSLMLIDAAEAALDPEIDPAALGLPRVTVSEAIQILKLHRFDSPGAPSHAGARGRARSIEAMPIEAVREEVMRRIDALREHRERQERALAGPRED